MDPMKEDHHAPSLRSAIEQLQIMLASVDGMSGQNDRKKRDTVFRPIVDLKRRAKRTLVETERQFIDAKSLYEDKKKS
eukprot:TRINITY_DN15182_c0_g1_i1.p1 TRINITY_DN15182_c0_g1~~TRINITY_DN15182_c0_g1_i1.p1  ORF type:complete len:78 (+),score=17.02 TRINITY_DN15182_c0_g1_i1:49-282(+)